jgi:hypothetical protein
LSSNTQQNGEIMINGRKEALAFGTSVCGKDQMCVLHVFTYRYVQGDPGKGEMGDRTRPHPKIF